MTSMFSVQRSFTTPLRDTETTYDRLVESFPVSM